MLPPPWPALIALGIVLALADAAVRVARALGKSDPLHDVRGVLRGHRRTRLRRPRRPVGAPVGAPVAPCRRSRALRAGWIAAASSLRAARERLGSWARAFSAPGDRWTTIGAVLAGFIAVALLLAALGPATDADSLDYHLGAAMEWLRAGGTTVRADWLHFRLAGLGEPLIALGPRRGDRLPRRDAPVVRRGRNRARARRARSGAPRPGDRGRARARNAHPAVPRSEPEAAAPARDERRRGRDHRGSGARRGAHDPHRGARCGCAVVRGREQVLAGADRGRGRGVSRTRRRPLASSRGARGRQPERVHRDRAPRVRAQLGLLRRPAVSPARAVATYARRGRRAVRLLPPRGGRGAHLAGLREVPRAHRGAVAAGERVHRPGRRCARGDCRPVCAAHRGREPAPAGSGHRVRSRRDGRPARRALPVRELSLGLRGVPPRRGNACGGAPPRRDHLAVRGDGGARGVCRGFTVPRAQCLPIVARRS